MLLPLLRNNKLQPLRVVRAAPRQATTPPTVLVQLGLPAVLLFAQTRGGRQVDVVAVPCFCVRVTCVGRKREIERKRENPREDILYEKLICTRGEKVGPVYYGASGPLAPVNSKY